MLPSATSTRNRLVSPCGSFNESEIGRSQSVMQIKRACCRHTCAKCREMRTSGARRFANGGYGNTASSVPVANEFAGRLFVWFRKDKRNDWMGCIIIGIIITVTHQGSISVFVNVVFVCSSCATARQPTMSNNVFWVVSIIVMLQMPLWHLAFNAQETLSIQQCSPTGNVLCRIMLVGRPSREDFSIFVCLVFFNRRPNAIIDIMWQACLRAVESHIAESLEPCSSQKKARHVMHRMQSECRCDVGCYWK